MKTGFFPLVLLTLLALPALLGCHDNMLTGNLTPIPPVHRLPPDVAGATVLVAEDPVIETRDPNHVYRANQLGVPKSYRASMESALILAGFRVTSDPNAPYDLAAKLALAVTERSENDITQIYRCRLAASDGTPIAQIDWTWPKGTYVESGLVLDFATHNVATEIAGSRLVVARLRERPKPTMDAGL